MILAIVKNGIVTNRIVAETWPDGVEIPQGVPVDIGWLYDGETFTAPTAPVVPPRRNDLTANDFLDLFTQTEQAMFEVAIESVRALISSGGTPNPVQAGLLVVNRRVSSVDLLSLDDPRIAASLDILIAAGIIQAGRKAVILTGVPVA
jgi:hypothetical protein